MIQIENLCKTFPVYQKAPGLLGSIKSLFTREYFNKEALKNINLTVQPGEILGLIGENGAGKTTLVKILSGIIAPSSGTARVLGFDPWERPNEYRKQLALIMGQKAQLWWDLPAYDSFLLLKEIYQIPEKTFKHNIDFLAEYLRVKDQLKIQVRRLSLGERMKVELMATLLHNPKVIYLDEPTIGLDVSAQKSVRNFLLRYQKEFKPITILTSHYMQDIEELCPRVALMKNGEIVYDGALSTIQYKYSNNKYMIVETKPESSQRFEEFVRNHPEGKLIHREEDKFTLSVAKSHLPEMSSAILSNFPVCDLTIENMDTADVIEQVLQDS